MERLIRSNLLLVFLCVISIGVLFIIFWKPKTDSLPLDQPKEMYVDGTTPKSDVASREPSLKDMPDPSIYETFMYPETTALMIDEPCKDAYVTVIIMPKEVDYRVDLARARYNTAAPCVAGARYKKTIDLNGWHLIEGESYYAIKADQGSGAWYNPR